MDGEGRCHVLGPARGDFSGGDEHESDLVSGVEELEGAVEVGELAAVRVADGGVEGEGEADGGGGVGGERKCGELDGGDGDLGVFGFEEREVDDEEDYEEEDYEDCGYYA